MSTLYPGNQHVIDSVVHKLRENVAALIDEANTLDTRGVTLDQVHPDDIFDYPATIREIVRFPALSVAELGGEWTQDIGEEATAEHSFAVICYCQAPEQWQLATQLRRLRTVVVSAVMVGRKIDHPTDPNLGAWGVRYDGYRPGRTLGAGAGEEPQAWISWTSAAFTALAEDHPT